MFELLTGLPPYYDDNIDIIYRNVAKGKLKFSNYIKQDAKDLIQVAT